MKALCKSHKMLMWHFGSNMAFVWWQTIWRYRKVEMGSKKFDCSDVGRAYSIKQQILTRIRKETGETIDWELLHWLATEAPDQLFKEIWANILSFWKVVLQEKKELERMKKLEWDFSSIPGTWDYASQRIPIINHGRDKGWRLPTVAELVFAIKSGFHGFGSDKLYWTDGNTRTVGMEIVHSYTAEVSLVMPSEEHSICHVRDRE